MPLFWSGADLEVYGIFLRYSGRSYALAFCGLSACAHGVELTERELTAGQWFALGFSVIYMAYAEGYRGFHRAFAPRVVVRALHLKNHPEPLHVLFAPIFCMGYIHATSATAFLHWSDSGNPWLHLLARNLSQPWRGIDAGVVVGLGLGILSICHFTILAKRDPAALDMPAEIPENNGALNNGSDGMKAS